MGTCVSRPEVHDAGLPGQQALPGKQPVSAMPPASTSAPEHTALSIISGKQPLTPGTPRQDTIPAKLAYARAQTPVGPPQACPPPSPLSQARLYRMAYLSNCAPSLLPGRSKLLAGVSWGAPRARPACVAGCCTCAIIS